VPHLAVTLLESFLELFEVYLVVEFIVSILGNNFDGSLLSAVRIEDVLDRLAKVIERPLDILAKVPFEFSGWIDAGVNYALVQGTSLDPESSRRCTRWLVGVAEVKVSKRRIWKNRHKVSRVSNR
jgi:hypothetical protein